MAREVKITKMVASGNDFVVIENSHNVTTLQRHRYLARKICDRKYGVGADGVLLLGKSRVADVKMRIFNADGSEAQMCGNGVRCAALYLSSKFKVQSSKRIKKIETKAGIIESEISGSNVKVKLTDPKDIKLDLPVKISGRNLRVNFINTGVPHAVIFVNGVEKIDAVSIGRQIRYHRKFSPRGTNVDFVEVLRECWLKVRTYERGVEDETLACGTGSVAAALITAIRNTQYAIRKINVYTRGGEVLKVYFERLKSKFINVWLEGEVRIVYQGVYYV